MRAVLLLICCLGLGGCFFSLDGSLVNRPRYGSVRDRGRDGIDGGVRETATPVDLAADVAVGRE